MLTTYALPPERKRTVIVPSSAPVSLSADYLSDEIKAPDGYSRAYAWISYTSDATSLLVSANEIRGDFLAHVINVTGAVHGLADPTSYGIPAAATTLATAITLLNALRTALPLHRAHTAGGVHGAADTSPGSAITAPIATDSLSAVTLAADLKAKLNYHEGVTAGGVHGIADVLNLVTSDDPALVGADYSLQYSDGEYWWDASGGFQGLFSALGSTAYVLLLDLALVVSFKIGLRDNGSGTPGSFSLALTFR